MVNSTVVEDEHTMRAWVGIHDLKQSRQPNEELIPIICTNLDVAIENSGKGYCRED